MWIFNYATLVDPILRNLREFVPEFSGMKAGDRVIDVCCGTGAQVLEYEHHGISAVGVDIDPAMLKIATRNSMRQKATDVSFQLADATSLPFPDGYFDYASISLALHDKEQHIRHQILSEMKRVIRQDGALILIDYYVPLPRNVLGIFARAIEYFVGGSHYQSFKDYLAYGGLDDLLQNHALQEKCRATKQNGLIMILKTVNGSYYRHF